MTTNQTETRPSDEMTGKVVAKKEGWEHRYIQPPREDSPHCWYVVGPTTDIKEDPRDNTDSALELLHWIIREHGSWDELDTSGDCWTFYIFENEEISERIHITISGQPFRYAVVRLAAKVMGIEEVDDG